MISFWTPSPFLTLGPTAYAGPRQSHPPAPDTQGDMGGTRCPVGGQTDLLSQRRGNELCAIHALHAIGECRVF